MTTENEPPEEKGKSTPEPIRQTFSPSGIELRPEPAKSPRISGRAAGLILLTGAAVLGVFAYGGLRRQHQQALAAEGSPYKKVVPARPDDVALGLSTATSVSVPANARPGVLPAEPYNPNQLQRPDSDLPKERVVVRRAQAAPLVVHEPTQEERALSVAYLTEQQARMGGPSPPG